MTDDIINQNGRPYEILASPRTWEEYERGILFLRALGYKGTIVLLNPDDAIYGDGEEKQVSLDRMIAAAVPEGHPYYNAIRKVRGDKNFPAGGPLLKDGETAEEYLPRIEEYNEYRKTVAGIKEGLLSPESFSLTEFAYSKDNLAIINVGTILKDPKQILENLSGISLERYPMKFDDTAHDLSLLTLAHELQHAKDHDSFWHESLESWILKIEVQADCGASDLVRAFNQTAGWINPEAIVARSDIRALATFHRPYDLNHATSAFITGDGTTCAALPTNEEVKAAMESLEELHGRVNEKIGQFYAGRVLEKLAVMGTGKGPTTFTGPLTFIESLGEAYGYENLVSSIADLDPTIMKIVGHKIQKDPLTNASPFIYGAVEQIAREGNLNPYQQKYVDNYLRAVERMVPSLAEDPEARKIAKFEPDRAVLHALAQDTLDARTIALAEKENERLKAEEDAFWDEFADGENEGTYGTEENNEEDEIPNEEHSAGVEPDNTPAPLSRAQSTAAPAPA